MKIGFHKQFLISLGVFTVILIGLVECDFQNLDDSSLKTSLPDVIFITSDDQRYDYLSITARNGLKVHTPNIERLVEQSVSFKNAYSNHPICSPTRPILLTGRWPYEQGIIDNHLDLGKRPDGNKTGYITHLFRDAGYQTINVGKWHVGLENDARNAGFHESYFPGYGSVKHINKP